MPVKHAHDVPEQTVKAGDFASLQVLQEGPNFIMRRFRMGPGGGMPDHTNTVEHEQYVLRGRARIVLHIDAMPRACERKYPRRGQADALFEIADLSGNTKFHWEPLSWIFNCRLATLPTGQILVYSNPL